MKQVFAGLVLLAAAAIPAAAAPPPVGVYGCFGQYGPAYPMYFGLLDGARYANFDGLTGRYKLTGDVLEMTDGPLKGVKYKRTGEQAFRMLDGKGNVTAYTCPKEGTKDPRKHPW
jgi:hypothetical protein